MASLSDTLDFSIRVPHPGIKIALTPPRESDGPAVITALNHPSVYLNLNHPPFPYTEKDWSDRFAIIASAWDQNRADLEVIRNQQQSFGAGKGWLTERWLTQPRWTSTIRDIGAADAAPSNGKFIGEIGVQKETFQHILDPEERQKARDANDKLEPGDPKTIWMIGYWLIPEYHGRGVMTAVLKSLMVEVMVPYMNAHTVHGEYLEHNPASRRVFEKCGYSFVGLTPNIFTINPSKLDGLEDKKVGVGLMSWVRRSSNGSGAESQVQ